MSVHSDHNGVTAELVAPYVSYWRILLFLAATAFNGAFFFFLFREEMFPLFLGFWPFATFFFLFWELLPRATHQVTVTLSNEYAVCKIRRLWRAPEVTRVALSHVQSATVVLKSQKPYLWVLRVVVDGMGTIDLPCADPKDGKLLAEHILKAAATAPGPALTRAAAPPQALEQMLRVREVERSE